MRDEEVIKQARAILAGRRTGEIAAALHLYPSNISGLKSGRRKLTVSMARRIVAACPRPAAPATKERGWVAANRFLEEVEKHQRFDELVSVARSVIAKVMREEVAPAMKEMLERAREQQEARLEEEVLRILAEYGIIGRGSGKR